MVDWFSNLLENFEVSSAGMYVSNFPTKFKAGVLSFG
jgi:hypothetical protein